MGSIPQNCLSLCIIKLNYYKVCVCLLDACSSVTTQALPASLGHWGSGPDMVVAASSFRRRWESRYGGSRDPMSCRIIGQAVVLNFISRQTNIWLMPAFIDLAEVLSSRRLRWRTPLGASCLEFAGTDGIQSCAPTCFFCPFGIRGSVEKLCFLLPSCDTSFMFHGEVRDGEWHGCQVLRTSNDDSSLCGD
jgi:hypothetical protein